MVFLGRLFPKGTDNQSDCTYYAPLLRQLRANIKVKRHGKLSQCVLFHQDNAPAYRSVIAMAAINDCGFE